MTTLELPGKPDVTVHLPPSADAAWICRSLERYSHLIASEARALFGNVEVTRVETHGPGMKLPSEYQASPRKDQMHFVGVTIQMKDETVCRHLHVYSTISDLYSGDGMTAIKIILDALEGIRTVLTRDQTTPINEEPTS